jgi:hypothetical protein
MAMKKLLLLLALPMLSSCAAIGVEAAAGIAVRAGAGAAAEGALISRVLVSEELAAMGTRGLTGAASDSLLQRSLAQLTEGGTKSAALSITRNGVIRSGSYEVASISPGTGEVMIGQRTIGKLADSAILENGIPVARLRGFVPASSLRVGTITERAGYQVLDRPLAVTIQSIQGNGLYLIRVGATESVVADASLLMLALLPVLASEGCDNDGGLAILKSGETYKFDQCQSKGDITSLLLNGKETLLYSDEIDGFVDSQTSAGLSANRIAFSSGDGTYGRVAKNGDLVEVTNDDQELVLLADTDRL